MAVAAEMSAVSQKLPKIRISARKSSMKKKHGAHEKKKVSMKTRNI
jgi:hypothetical protein